MSPSPVGLTATVRDRHRIIDWSVQHKSECIAQLAMANYRVVQEPVQVETNPNLAHLLQEHDGLCWWCGAPADSAEHKYKRTDLQRMLGADDFVVWGSQGRPLRSVRSVRKDPQVRFRASLCKNCNTTRSQAFDRAYDRFAEYVDAQMPDLWRMDGIPMRAVFDPGWEAKSVSLAQYFIKHFGCRIVEAGIAPPSSLRDFLDDGSVNMPDAHLALIKLRTRRNMGWAFHRSLFLSTFHVSLAQDSSRFTGIYLASYIGYVGVRFEWHEMPWPHDSFFGHERPIVNAMNDEQEVVVPPTPLQRSLRALNPLVRFRRQL